MAGERGLFKCYAPVVLGHDRRCRAPQGLRIGCVVLPSAAAVVPATATFFLGTVYQLYTIHHFFIKKQMFLGKGTSTARLVGVLRRPEGGRWAGPGPQAAATAASGLRAVLRIRCLNFRASQPRPQRARLLPGLSRPPRPLLRYCLAGPPAGPRTSRYTALQARAQHGLQR